MQDQPTLWLTFRTMSVKARVRLFCFPHAGGSSLTYRPWQSQIPNFVDVCPVELPGHGTRRRESPLTSLPEMVEAAGKGIAPALDMPFAFFGHSMGALIAFEVARYLKDSGAGKPVGIFASGRQAPHLIDRDAPIHALPEAEFLKELRDYNGTPDDILHNDELMELLLPTLRADFMAIETYRGMPSTSQIHCPITVVGGLADSVTREELEAWRAYTDGHFSLRMFDGDHFFLYGAAEAQLLEVLARELLGWTES
jgi:medium-chain acyl-[acyl-carrier-protein] hydrolase